MQELDNLRVIYLIQKVFKLFQLSQLCKNWTICELFTLYLRFFGTWYNGRKKEEGYGVNLIIYQYQKRSEARPHFFNFLPDYSVISYIHQAYICYHTLVPLLLHYPCYILYFLCFLLHQDNLPAYDYEEPLHYHH